MSPLAQSYALPVEKPIRPQIRKVLATWESASCEVNDGINGSGLAKAEFSIDGKKVSEDNSEYEIGGNYHTSFKLPQRCEP